MASKYLDFVGLSRFLDKLKGLFAPKKQGIEYINGTQTASTNVWTGETTDNELYEGKMIAYRLPFAGTSSGATLNLTFANGTTSGAKNVYLSTSTRMTTHVAAGNTVILVYHEANVIGSTTYQGWWMDAYYNSDGSAYQMYVYGSRGGHTVTNCPPICMFLTQSENRLLPTWAGTASSTAATHVMTTEEFDPFGNIYYKGSNAYNAGVLIGQALYYQIQVDLRYAFNTNGFDLLDSGVGATIYMVCEPTANGKAVLYSNQITKTLPIEDDGLLYVYLGRSYSSTSIYLMLNHPVYMFDAEAGEAIAIDRSYLLDRDKNRIVTETDPYIYRQTGDGKAIGDIEVLDKIVGGTVCWNQWASFSQSVIPTSDGHGVIYEYVDGTSVKITGTSDTNTVRTGWFAIAENAVKLMLGHKVLITTTIRSGSYTGDLLLHIYGSQQVSIGESGIVSVPLTNGTVQKRLTLYVTEGSTFSDLICSFNVFDLTQMFGSTIADYIYSLETATAGAGVEWFKRYFPNDYYAYNPGELISVTGLQEHKIVGKNLLSSNYADYAKPANRSYAFINAVIPEGRRAIFTFADRDTSIDMTGVYIGFCEDDIYQHGTVSVYRWIIQNGVMASARSNFIPEVNAYCRNVFIYPKNEETFNKLFARYYIAVELAESGNESSGYEPYISHSTALDSNVTLRGIFSLDSPNKLTCDGDVWTPDGKIERHYGEVDLGELTWDYNGTRFAATLTNKKISTSRLIGLCAEYTVENSTVADAPDKSVVFGVSGDMAVYIKDSTYSDTATFKTAMSGVKLVYELAEPVSEDAPTYSSMQKADPAGTEEFVSTAEVKIPVGHGTRYMLAPKLYDETQSQLSAIRKEIEGEFVSAKNEQTFTPNQQLQARENIGATGIEWIQSTQTATTGNWTGVSRDTALYDGKIICYRLSYAGSGNASLNLTLADGTETGPIPVYWHSTTRVTTHQAYGTEWLYVYHEDYISPVDNSHKGPGWWSLTRAYYENSAAYISRDNTPPKVKSTLYRYMLCFSDVDTQLIPASNGNNNTGTTKTITTDSFDPFGRIYYYATTTTVNAGSRPAENVMVYGMYAFDIRYSFNMGATLTAQMPVYVACVPQSDGRVKLAENPIVQTIPLDSEEDGLIYIYLGQARSTSSICLNAVHDIYKVYNGAIYNIKALML